MLRLARKIDDDQTIERDPEHLLAGISTGAKLSPDTLFSRGSHLIVDCSHVQNVRHEGLSVVPVEEVFADPEAVFLGFGFPNVYVAMPRDEDDERGSGWDRFAAFMFFRQAAYIHDTKGRVQGGMFVELRGLSHQARAALRNALEQDVGKRHVSCANATGRALTAAGFTCGGRKLSRKVRPMRLARTIWERGLEFRGEAIELRLIRTNGGTVTDHFAGVIRKEATSGFRAIKKIVAKKKAKPKAPVIEPRELIADLSSIVTKEVPGLASREVFVGRPSKIGAFLRRQWGEHPIFEVETIGAQPDLNSFSALSAPLKPYPGKLDLLGRLKRYVLFSRPVVKTVRRQMAVKMDSLGTLPAQSIINMLQVGPPEQPFIYNMVLTGTSVRLSRLENQSEKDNDKANWVLAKHVLLSGYDPDVRFAGEVWAEDTSEGRIMHINNNSGTYKPSDAQTTQAHQFLSEVFGVPAVAHAA